MSATFCASPLTKRPRLVTPSHLTPRCTATSYPSFPPERALQQKVESHILDSEQQSDLVTPPLTPLPVQLDLLNYHARIASRRRATRATAERLYRRCIRINSTDGRAWLGMARLYINEGDIDSARGTFRNAIRASRNNPHLLQAWGVMEQRQNCIQRAKGLFEAAVRADPSHCASWVALGMWYRKFSNDLVSAREAFRKGAQADEGNYYVWHVWGVLEMDCRRYPIARQCFKRGVEANPNNAATYVMWGLLEDKLGNYTKAIQLFEKAHVAHPRNIHAYVSHAASAERAGFVDKASSLLETAVAIRPNDPAPRQALALLEFRRGAIEKARELFKAALDVDLKHGPTWHAWACVEMKLGEIKTARALFQEAVWAAPRSPHVVRTWHSWGMLEMEMGNNEKARRYFGHGLDVDAENIALLTGLATVEGKEGNMGRMRENMEKCIKLEPYRSKTWRVYEDLEREFGNLRRAQLVYERRVIVEQQVDERVVVSQAMPGDFKAGGMWIDALELSPNESAFESIRGGGDVVGKQRKQRKRTGRKGERMGENRTEGVWTRSEGSIAEEGEGKVKQGRKGGNNDGSFGTTSFKSMLSTSVFQPSATPFVPPFPS